MATFWKGFVLLLIFSISTTTFAQPKPTGNTKRLDVEAENAQAAYLKSLASLATEYETLGNIEKSKEMLNLILQVRPDSDQVKRKLKEFDEAIFDANNTVIEVDTAKGWMNSGIMVSKDRDVRLEAAGAYKFITNDNLGPEGYLQTSNNDFIGKFPAGALIGMIAAPPAGGNRNRQKEPEPFLIGAEHNLKPEESGVLFLRVNAPQSAKCIGKIKVKVSGNILPARR